MVSLYKLKNSFGYAGEGLRYAFKNDQNFRIHLVAALVVILLALFFRVERIELTILFVMILLVLWAEMINTTVEKIVDLITEEHRVNAKIAKDVSGAMVLLTAIGATVIGAFIFLPYIQKMF